MSDYINSVQTGLSRKDNLILVAGVVRMYSGFELPLDVSALILVFYNFCVFITIPRKTIIYKTQEMESTLDLVWQSEKILYFGNKNKWKRNCDDDNLLFTKIMKQNTEIDGYLFEFDIYYETIKRRIYLTITLNGDQQYGFSYFLHIYCTQNGKAMKQIIHSSSTKFDLMQLKHFIDNKRCNELQIKCLIKIININGQKKTLKKCINEYILRYIHIDKNEIYLFDNDNKWAIITIYNKENNSLSMYLQLLLYPVLITKLDIRCSIEIKSDDNMKINGLIFEKKHTFSTRLTKSSNHNFKWRTLDISSMKKIGVLTKEELSKIDKLAFYVSIEILNIYDIQHMSAIKSDWSKYGIL